MEAYGRREILLHVFFTRVLNVYVNGQLHALAALPRVMMACTNLIVGLVAPRDGLDALEKSTVSYPC
jgi:hypothetical protein